LDTALHMSAYVLNPYYLYNDLEVQNYDDLNDAIVELAETLFEEDYNMQNQITLHKFPMYKGKLEKFSRAVAIKGCEVNDEKYDPALWWSMYGGSTPNRKKISMRILSLTTSSSGCERNWSTFEGVHTKKRNRLDATRMRNLVYVQFNANLMEKNKRRKAKDHEVSQEWIVKGEVCEDGVEGGLPRETVSDDIGTRTSARLRELYEEEFESEGEVEVDDEIEYEVLTEGVVRSLSALIYCRDLDTITLGDLIDSDGKLILEYPRSGVPRVGIPMPPRALMQNLYDRMGRMEIRQDAIERMEYRQSYH
nr:hypothetical protein [Tanacetum cinerariifolium]